MRALDFGSYPNPIGLPKLAVGRDIVVISEIEILDAVSSCPPGTVTYIDTDFISVSALDSEIALRKLLTIDGESLSIADFVARFALYEGYQFEEIDPETATRITTYNALICQYEGFWVKRLETLENITLPYAHWKTSPVQSERFSCVPMPVRAEILTSLEDRFATLCKGDVLLAAFTAYLVRIAGAGSFDLGYRDSKLAGEVKDLESIFAAHVPLHVSVEGGQSFEEVFHTVQEQVKQTKKRKTYARDIIARYPALHARTNIQGAYLPSICVELVETLLDYKVLRSSEMTLVIREDGEECMWAYHAEVLDEESVVEMQQGFTAFLQGIVSDPKQRISDLPILTDEERHRLLVEWNATHASYPTDKRIHELFEAQVDRTQM